MVVGSLFHSLSLLINWWKISRVDRESNSRIVEFEMKAVYKLKAYTRKEHSEENTDILQIGVGTHGLRSLGELQVIFMIEKCLF